MPAMIDRPLRAVIRALKNSDTVRNLLSDVNSVGEFTDLYEHEKMLADRVRVETYRKGIARLIRPGDVVVDLGTGTGVLSLFAAQQQPKRVYAVDHSQVIELARAIAEHNKLHDRIEFLHLNSRDLRLDEPVDVILHEQIGDELFDENMVANIVDLRNRLLKPGGRIVPGRFALYLEPVQLADADRVPFVWENPVVGLDYSFLRDHPLTAPYTGDGYRHRWLEGAATERLLCRPEPVLTVDLAEISGIEDLPRRVPVRRQVTTPGRCDGLLVYFEAIFDQEVRFDSCPLWERTPSWGNKLFRAGARDCREGDVLEYEVNFGDHTRVDTWQVEFA